LIFMNFLRRLAPAVMIGFAWVTVPSHSQVQPGLATELQGQDFAPSGVIDVTQVTATTPVLPDTTAKRRSAATIVKSAPGPWGRLGVFPGVHGGSDVPGGALSDPQLPPRMGFPASSLPQLPDFLSNAGLEHPAIDAMLAKEAVILDGDMAFIFPPLSLLESLSWVQRTVIYAELRKIPRERVPCRAGADHLWGCR